MDYLCAVLWIGVGRPPFPCNFRTWMIGSTSLTPSIPAVSNVLLTTLAVAGTPIFLKDCARVTRVTYPLALLPKQRRPCQIQGRRRRNQWSQRGATRHVRRAYGGSTNSLIKPHKNQHLSCRYTRGTPARREITALQQCCARIHQSQHSLWLDRICNAVAN
jgi:hypothetical protein